MEKGLVVVTGASKGIGRAIVEKFFEEGYHVVACARGDDHLGALKNSLGDGPGKIDVVQADMSVKSEVQKLGGFVLGLNKPVSILVNNVGVFLPGMIIDEEDGLLEKQISTNLYSAYYLTRALIPGMIENQSGHIFNICSTASIGPYENGSSYSITKYALLGFSHNLREEVKEKGIRVTAILPGNTLTPSWGETDIPKEKFIMPEDVADSIYSIAHLSPGTNVEDVLIQPTLKR